MTRRFPIVPVVAIILKVVAIILLVTATYSTIRSIPQAFPMLSGAGKGFWDKVDLLMNPQFPLIGFLQNFLTPAMFWILAEFGLSFREIEFNTRRAVPADQQEVEAEPWSPAPPVAEQPETPAAS
jgi:hypothetical protein